MIDVKQLSQKCPYLYVVGFGIALLTMPARAEEPRPSPDAQGRATQGANETAGVAMMEPAQAAVDHGLAYLVSRQQEDGSLSTGGYGRNAAVVALSGMAWLAGGSTPDRGPYGQQVSRATDYLLDHTLDSGFITVEDAESHGPMYGHGFATLFLAEVYGMSPRDDLRDKLQKAIELIVRTQNTEGGWRYQPRKEDADISVTICQVMALRAARNAGLTVPRETVDRCVDYVKRSQNGDGGFRYMLPAGPSGFPRSAAGVVALYSAGIYEGDEVSRGLGYLEQFAPGAAQVAAPDADAHFFYGHYYAVQAMWHAGGARWQHWYPAVRDELVKRQKPDGSWADAICPEYGTAMACIILQMPNNCVPIFQR
jgi:Squalene-hopene cyclase C-terminal domain/Prenyltransferase and squalene oxidase repeat